MGKTWHNFSIVRVFSTVKSRRAPEDERHSFKSEAEMAVLKGAAELDEKTVSKFPTTDKMVGHPGKKEGEIRIFREGIL